MCQTDKKINVTFHTILHQILQKKLPNKTRESSQVKIGQDLQQLLKNKQPIQSVVPNNYDLIL